MYSLTEEGKAYLKSGLPEENLMKALRHPAEMQALQKHVSNFHIALSWAKKKGWIRIEGSRVVPVKQPSGHEELDALKRVANGQDIGSEAASQLLSRNLITERVQKQHDAGGISALTQEMIKSGSWKNTEFRPYNVSLVGEKVFPGKPHILSHFKRTVREIFFDMGFSEAEGPLIESSFWNFDALFQPQDHPARDMADTFYMEVPKETKLPEKSMVDKISAAHENGYGTGSVGWRYKWSREVASQPVLRTHTTAVSARSLPGIKQPAKVFCIGTVFRNETIAYKTLPQFTQIEGIVADNGLTFQNLLGYLKEFYLRMGFSKVRFRPAYFPYTEMSVEPEVYFEEKGSWLELGGAGIFRPEVTKPLGVDCTVLAWGLGLERLIMLKMGISDIRNFYYRNDLKLLREARLWQ